MVGYQQFRRPSLTTTLGHHPDTKNGIFVLFDRFIDSKGNVQDGLEGRILTLAERASAARSGNGPVRANELKKGEPLTRIEMPVVGLTGEELELLNEKGADVAYFRVRDQIRVAIAVVKLTDAEMQMLEGPTRGPLVERPAQ